MRIKPLLIIVISFIGTLTAFQNCESSKQVSLLPVEVVLQEGKDSKFSQTHESVDTDLEASVYPMENVINILNVIQETSSNQRHFLGKPYPLFNEQILTNDEKSEIIYFRCRDNQLQNCYEELLESARILCSKIGSSEYSVEEWAPSSFDENFSFGAVTRSEDPTFTVRLKSGELKATSLKYLFCFRIDYELYQRKIQPLKY